MKKPTEVLYGRFQEAYDFFNDRLFENKLPACVITFQRQKRIMGYVSLERWINQQQEYTHELAINPEYFANYPLVEICQTLCHEMVHIWQAQFGNAGRRGYHNRQWANKMMVIGLMPSTTGEPGGDIVGEHVGDYILNDGPFIRAFNELASSGFHLAWMDRYPVVREETTTVIYTQSGKPVELDTKAPAAASMLMERRSEHSTTQLPYSFEELDAAFTSAFTPQLLPPAQVGSVPTTRPKISSNKHKYRCPKCHLQLWGKPELYVICGECNAALVESE
ncbi:MAG: SprT-like domain-containing protein [Spongiibacteraceae bacterium]